MKQYLEDRWFLYPHTGEIKHLRGGECDLPEGAEIPWDYYDVTIPHHLIPSLVAFLDKEGYVKPKMDNQSRAEDLKIVHRLFDLLEKKP